MWWVNLIMGHRGHQSTGQCPRRGSPILSGRSAVRGQLLVAKVEGWREQDVNRTGRRDLLPKYLLSTWGYISLQRRKAQDYSQVSI